MEKCTNFILHLNFPLKCITYLKENKGNFLQNWYLALLSNTFYMLKVEIWWIKTISLLAFYRKPPNFVKCLEFFLKYKLILEGNRADFIMLMVYCITVRYYWCNHTWILIKYWHINCHLLWEMFPFYCPVWNFFENIKVALKKVRVTLWRTDALHHCNRLLVCLNLKFEEFKEFYLVRIKKKRTKFLQFLELFLKYKPG